MPIQRKKPVQIQADFDNDDQVDWAPKIDEQSQVADFRSALERLKSRDGIIGYIIRGPTSASVDIKDPSKIIDYAALSAEAVESSETLSSLFGLGKVNCVVLAGKNVKVMSFKRGQQELSVFMENSVDHKAVYEEIG